MRFGAPLGGLAKLRQCLGTEKNHRVPNASSDASSNTVTLLTLLISIELRRKKKEKNSIHQVDCDQIRFFDLITEVASLGELHHIMCYEQYRCIYIVFYDNSRNWKIKTRN